MSYRVKDVLTLVGCVLACQAAGAIGGLFTASSVRTWYAGLAKPAFSPPSWVFAPVWTALYALMGVSVWLVLRKGGVRGAVVLFVVQLLLNVAWSFLFFELRNPLAAFVELIALWIVIVITTVWFYRLSVAAGVLMVPYLLWVSFAGVLNYWLWRLN